MKKLGEEGLLDTKALLFLLSGDKSLLLGRGKQN